MSTVTSGEDDRKFKVRDLVEHTDGRGSLGKTGQLTALVVSSVCFVWMAYANTMTEFYFVGYMVTWAGANVANKLADYKRQSAESENATNT